MLVLELLHPFLPYRLVLKQSTMTNILNKASIPMTSHIQNAVTGAAGTVDDTTDCDMTVKVAVAGSLGTGSIALTCQKYVLPQSSWSVY